jgi:hypothetical protein
MKITAVYSENHMKVFLHHVGKMQLFNIQPGGIYNYHWASEG